MPAQKPPTADEKIEAFHLWTQGDDRRAPEGTPVVIVLASVVVVALLGLAYVLMAAL